MEIAMEKSIVGIVEQEQGWNSIDLGLETVLPKQIWDFQDESCVILLNLDFPMLIDKLGFLNQFEKFIIALKHRGFSTLYLSMAFSFDFSLDFCIEQTGLQIIINRYNLTLLEKLPVELNSSQENSHFQAKTVKSPISHYIIWTQNRLDPYWGVHCSFSSLVNYFKQNFNLIQFFTRFSRPLFDVLPRSDSGWISLVHKFIKLHPPLLVVNNCWNISTSPNSLGLGERTQNAIKKYIIANDIYAADIKLFHHLDLFSEEELREKGIFSIFKDFSSEFYDTVEIGTPSENPVYRIQYTNKISMKNLKCSFYFGEIEPFQQSALYDFLSMMDAMSAKDGINLENFNIIAGKNPPLPPNSSKIVYIVFGNEAIESTQNASFRKLSSRDLKEAINILGYEFGNKKVYDGIDLERLIHNKTKKYRKKIQNLRKKWERAKNLYNEEKQEGKLPIVMIQKYNKEKFEIDKMILKLQLKLDLKRIQLEYQNEQLKFKFQRDDFILNPKVLEIPGNQPNALDCLKLIPIIMKKELIPTYRIYLEFISTFYNFKEQKLENVRRNYKNRLKILKKASNEANKKKSPLIKEELTKLKRNFKAKNSEIKTDFSQEQSSLSQKYKEEQQKVLLRGENLTDSTIANTVKDGGSKNV